MVLIANFDGESEQVLDIWETMVVKLLVSLRRVQLPAVPSRDSSYLLYVNLNSIYQIEIHEICFVKDSVKDLSVWNV